MLVRGVTRIVYGYHQVIPDVCGVMLVRCGGKSKRESSATAESKSRVMNKEKKYCRGVLANLPLAHGCFMTERIVIDVIL